MPFEVKNKSGVKFKRGQSGNPKGRPKGSLNKKTIIKNLIEHIITDKSKFGKGLDFVEKDEATVDELLYARLVSIALRGKGNEAINAAKILKEYYNEKPIDTVEKEKSRLQAMLDIVKSKKQKLEKIKNNE